MHNRNQKFEKVKKRSLDGKTDAALTLSKANRLDKTKGGIDYRIVFFLILAIISIVAYVGVYYNPLIRVENELNKDLTTSSKENQYEFTDSGTIKGNEDIYKNALDAKLKRSIIDPYRISIEDKDIKEIPAEENYEHLIQKLVSAQRPTISRRAVSVSGKFPISSSQPQVDKAQLKSRAGFMREASALLKLDFGRYSESSAVLPNCRVQLEPVFVLGEERDKGGMLGSSHDRPLVYMNLTVSEFLKGTFRPDMWLYWTGELRYLEESLGLPFTPDSIWETFMVNESRVNIMETVSNATAADSNDSDNSTKVASDSKSASSIARPMLWLSHPGVVAQTHYDTQHNIFIQLQGFKRFLLFPPSTELYSYPNIHRSYRQSQVLLEDIDKGSFPSVTSTTVKAIEVNLKPGDILYIPPYWHHRVESTSLSLSLSVLSPSEIEAALAEIYWLQVPFGEFRSSKDTRFIAVRAYFQEIFRLLRVNIFPDGLEKFAKDLFTFRFAPLQSSIRGDDAVTCPAKNYNASSSEAVLLKKHRDSIKSIAEDVVDLLKAAQCDSAIKITFLRDYMEQLVRWAVGPQKTGAYIRACFES